MPTTGVYMIQNTVNQKCYIGSTVRSFISRWRNHKNTLSRGCHVNLHLQAAWVKYGAPAFKFLVCESCPPEACVAREQWWINGLKPEYNMHPLARSSLGIHRSEATKAKIRMARIGSHHTPESCAKMSQQRLGRKPWNLGVKMSESFRDQCRHRKFSPESREKMSLAQKTIWANRRLILNHQ